MRKHGHYHHHPWGQGHKHYHDEGHHAAAPFGKPPNVIEADMELLHQLKESIEKVKRDKARLSTASNPAAHDTIRSEEHDD